MKKGSNTKDANSSKSKPSELLTSGLKIGNQKIMNHEILTKIFFGKKQFVWELTELNAQSSSVIDLILFFFINNFFF